MERRGLVIDMKEFSGTLIAERNEFFENVIKVTNCDKTYDYKAVEYDPA